MKLDQIGIGIDVARYEHVVQFLSPDRKPLRKPLRIKESPHGYQRLERALRAALQLQPMRLQTLRRALAPLLRSVSGELRARGACSYDDLLRKGIIVRPVANYGLPEHIRVTVGTEAENARFLQALEEVLAS